MHVYDAPAPRKAGACIFTMLQPCAKNLLAKGPRKAIKNRCLHIWSHGQKRHPKEGFRILLKYFSRTATGRASGTLLGWIWNELGHHFDGVSIFFKEFPMPFPHAGCMQDVGICISYGVRRCHAARRLQSICSPMRHAVLQPQTRRTCSTWLPTCSYAKSCA